MESDFDCYENTLHRCHNYKEDSIEMVSIKTIGRIYWKKQYFLPSLILTLPNNVQLSHIFLSKIQQLCEYKKPTEISVIQINFIHKNLKGTIQDKNSTTKSQGLTLRAFQAHVVRPKYKVKRMKKNKTKQLLEKAVENWKLNLIFHNFGLCEK